MSVAEKTFGIGNYWTEEGYEAVVDAVIDGGQLVGRININTCGASPVWQGYVWDASGESQFGATFRRLCTKPPAPSIEATYWVNIYASGPGLLRKDWEQCLVEASRSEEEVLARVKVPIKTRVGEGLK